MSTTVLTVAPPGALTVSATAVALSFSGKLDGHIGVTVAEGEVVLLSSPTLSAT
jgi:hypothetical protein